MTLHEEILELRKQEKRICSAILDKLQLMEEKRLYLRMGYSSLFDYLVRALGYSESTAYQRQSCLRLSKEIPEIKEKINTGRLSLSAIGAAYKTIKTKPLEEKKILLKQIEHKSARQVKTMLAEPARPIKIHKTEYQDKVILRLELTHEQNQKLERLKSLKSHQGQLAELFQQMIDRELKEFENRKHKPTQSKNLRYIPKRLRNAVLGNANYKCQHPGCESQSYLQIDHIHPVRNGGSAALKNLQVLCGAHNRMKG